MNILQGTRKLSIPKRLWQTHKVISNLLNGIYNKQIIVIRSSLFHVRDYSTSHYSHCLPFYHTNSHEPLSISLLGICYFCEPKAISMFFIYFFKWIQSPDNGACSPL